VRRRGWIVSGVAVSCGAVAIYWLGTGGVDVVRGIRPDASGVVRAQFVDTLRPVPSFDGEPPRGATAAARRTIEILARVEGNTRQTRYQHRTRIDERLGTYLWDCSGLTAWVVERASPRARRALASPRPVARTFARTITRAPTARHRRGWQRIDHIRDVRPGDVFAWETPPGFASRSTGHVGFVVHRPLELDDDLWALRILDSTSIAHQDDTRPREHGGTGRGTMTFVVGDDGRATAYGWFGTRSIGYIATPIVFGRIH
jgi:hypothetical protein